MNLPQISVLLPIYKEPHQWIKIAIESILNQTFTNFDLLILVDNPFDKDLIVFLKNYQSDTRVQLIINSKNLGLPKTLNIGIDLAKGKYIARMDADDIATPKRLEKQYNFMIHHPAIDLCGSEIIKMDREGKLLGKSKLFNDSALLKKLVIFQNIITHPTWLVKKNVLIEIGKYRNFPNAEDYDLVHRLLDNGKKVTNLKDVLLYWRVHNQGQTGRKSLAQKICFTYIQELHKERKKIGTDSFNEKKLLERIKYQQTLYGSRQQKAQDYLIKTFQYQRDKKYLLAIYTFIKSFMASPIQRNYYINLLNAKLVVFHYSIKNLIWKKPDF